MGMANPHKTVLSIFHSSRIAFGGSDGSYILGYETIKDDITPKELATLSIFLTLLPLSCSHGSIEVPEILKRHMEKTSEHR